MESAVSFAPRVFLISLGGAGQGLLFAGRGWAVGSLFFRGAGRVSFPGPLRISNMILRGMSGASTGVSSGACLGHQQGHVWCIIWACLGHVWGMSGQAITSFQNRVG